MNRERAQLDLELRRQQAALDALGAESPSSLGEAAEWFRARRDAEEKMRQIRNQIARLRQMVA
jgi:hypothetical protein